MISLRSTSLSLTAVVVASLTIAGCGDEPTNPLARTMAPAAASLSRVNSSNNTSDAAIDARVLMDKSGNAVLEIRTGTFTDATNTGTPNGTFSKLEYKVIRNGKTIRDETINIRGSLSTYTDVLNLCAGTRNDNDDDNGRNYPFCATRFAYTDQVTVTASVQGVDTKGNDKGPSKNSSKNNSKTDGAASNVTVPASIYYMPDIDLTGQSVYVGTGTSRTATGSVTPGTATTYSVDFPNTKSVNGVAPSVGASTVCAVEVDGHTQLPLPISFLNPFNFRYIGSATQDIAAGTALANACVFSLTLPAGSHTITVTAVPTYPGDYDLSNNSTTKTFKVSTSSSGSTGSGGSGGSGTPVAADLAVTPLQVVGTPNTLLSSTPVKQNATVTLVDSVTNLSTTGSTTVVCSALSINAVAPTGITIPANVGDTVPSALQAKAVGTTSFALAAGAGGVCQYQLTAPSNLGLVSVPLFALVTPASGLPADPNLANNVSTGTFTIASNGQFSVVPTPSLNPSAVSAEQSWIEPFSGTVDGVNGGLTANNTLPATASLTSQTFDVQDLALLVIPTTASLGSFALTDSIYTDNGTLLGVATVPAGTLAPALDQTANCSPTAVGPAAQLGQTANTKLTYAAQICAATAQAGFQQITVGITQSLFSPLDATAGNAVLYTGTLKMRVHLDFQLTNAPNPDHVTATVTIAVKNLSNGCMDNGDGTESCSTKFAPYVVTTP